VGVSRTVKQVCGTAVREGREIIVLAGVDATKISTTALKDLKKWLEEKLDQFQNSVLSKTDWSQLSDRNVLIEEAVLGEWLKEIDQERKLPHTDWCSGPRPRSGAPQASLSEQNSPRSRGERWSRRPLTLLVCLLLAYLLFDYVGILPRSLIAQPNSWWWELFDTSYNSLFRSRTKRDTAADPNYKRSDSKQEPCNLKGHITKLAEEWHCTELAVVHSLLRASNWDRRHKADEVKKVEQVLNDRDLCSLLKPVLEEMMKTEGTNRLFMSQDFQSEQDLHACVQNYVLGDPDDVGKCRAFRDWLFETWTIWNMFKREVERTNSFLSISADGSHKMLEMLANVKLDECYERDFFPPQTPLFDRQDRLIWGFLKEILNVMKDLGLISNEYTTQGLPMCLKEIKQRREEIKAAVRRSRDECLKQFSKSQESEAARLVAAAFIALELFIDKLAEFNCY